MTHYYCSTFSKDYAYKGLLLYNSLLRWDNDFHFFMICLHDEVKELYEQMNLKYATILTLSAVEREDRRLQVAKETRSDKEYVWTSKASVMLFILKHFQHTDHIIWLDGDTFFYSNPDPIFEEWGEYSILLTEERWRKTDKHKINHYGRYNTGFMGFKRDEHAIQCLNWFRNSLIEWCFDKREYNLWSDQLYVNDWLERFNNVGVIQNMGINVNPYIMIGNQATKDGNNIYINGEKLILFHHYGFRYYDGNEFDLCSYMLSFSDDVLKWIYLPYIRACNEIMDQICKVNQYFYPLSKPKGQLIRNYFNLEANETAGEETPNICTLLTKDYVIQGLALYYSLKRHTPRFQLWVLCVDNTTYYLLEKMNLDNVTLISLENIRSKILAKIERKRQLHEFCWTVKASLVTFLIKNNYNLNSILYMDADLFFFMDARGIYNEWGDNSVFLTKLWLGRNWTQKVGRYSAGLIGFKRDQTGMKCLQSWRRQCLKWCYDRRENGLWADQKYLDDWPRLFSGIKISKHKGINAGPWNIKRGYKVHAEGNDFYFDNMKLICYHFSGFEITNEIEFELCNRKKIPAKAKNIYSIYIEEIRKVIAQIKSVDSSFIHSITGKKRSKLLNPHIALHEEWDHD